MINKSVDNVCLTDLVPMLNSVFFCLSPFPPTAHSFLVNSSAKTSFDESAKL